MGFLKTSAEIAAGSPEKFVFYDAEILMVYFETKPEVIKRLLPAPLQPAKVPVAAAFVANYPKTNFGRPYLESALFLLAEFNGEEGAYCLAMPVTDDMALIGGREVFGYPKKIATIALKRNGERIEGWTERHGVRFFEVRTRLSGKFNEDLLQQLIMERMSSPAGMDQIIFNFKYFPGPALIGFDYRPRLIREVVELRPKSMEMGEAELTFRPSEQDPWSEVEIIRVLGAVYSVGENTMLPGRVVAEADPISFAPYAFMKVDSLLSGS